MNTFRLFVGESYDLLLVAISFIGLAMVWKREVVNIPIKRFLGTIFILISITTLLHYNLFYPQEPLEDSIFTMTFNIFKNEFVTGQHLISLGGGMLGAVFYASFGYLFGRMGTYLLVGIVFFIGLLLITNATFDAFISAIKVIISSLGNFFKGVGHSINEARYSYKDSFEEEEDTDIEEFTDDTIAINDHQSFEIDNTDEFNEYINYQNESSIDKSLYRKKGLFEKIKDNFYRSRKADDYQLPLEWRHRHEPPIDLDRNVQFETYDHNDMIATTAANERARLEREKDLVLDLDYFDQINEQSETSVDLEDSSLDSHTYHERDLVNQPNNDEEDVSKPIINGDHQLNSTDLSSLDGRETKGSFDETEANESEMQPNASHWQQQSSRIQNTTSNELDSVLESSQQLSKNQTSNKAKSNHKGYKLPQKNLLTKIPPVDQSEEYKRINENIKKLERTFESFGVDAKVVKANLGPSVTKYEVEPAIGVKVSKIVSLTDDISLALAARDVRMEAPIPGKSLIGIEVPNTQVSPVSFWEIVDAGLKSPNILEVPLGRDISGTVCTADLSKMPHLLIAGATGSGKSVGMNVIIISLLMKAKPNEVKFLMIDPKKVELTMYNELPHLLSPVVTNPRKAAQALNNVVQEMEHRYELFASTGVRNIEGYNDYVKEQNKTQGTAYEQLPKIVVFIDELADLMMVASNDVETAITRLAQMARAAGIHMIIATQRPSVDVITGIIKANVPSRLAFAVSSGTDSRTILDSVGAEKLLGRGDMLFQPMGMNKPLRVQGAYISDAEVERITDFIKDQSEPEYDESIVVSEESLEQANASEDEYFEDAINLIREQETISISQLQRRFRIGYNRAARLIDDLEAIGYVSEADGSKPRQVLIND
ncbi:DNA translocase FtsK [Aerococcaceae bacterium WGS1372]